MNDTARLLDLVNQINHQKGKHMKNTLVQLEQSLDVDHLDAGIRKAVLDGFNDFTRSVFSILGYTVDV